MKRRFRPEEYAQKLLEGDIVMLSQAITLVESRLESDRLIAEKLMEIILPHVGKSIRVGITGVPGVGKSTFIESFGSLIANQGHKLAVLTIDPSSQRSGGSILGDKTRMESLSNHPNAYVRPSASGHSLGGVQEKTRETMLLCEAAGFDVILIETVGVGQSEVAVEGMVDFFLLLMLSGAGDELQGIKRGIMEIADSLVITKSDGDNIDRSKLAARQYQNALHLFPPSDSGWIPKVMTCSAVENSGLDHIWNTIKEYESLCKSNGYFGEKRASQNLKWLKENIQSKLNQMFYQDEGMAFLMKNIERQVSNDVLPVNVGVRQLMEYFLNNRKEGVKD
ncbi:methylmalonyl Co-A mutase-associated GTPase MeaB [Aureibacter tunicatorum]|uniref:LAO/AO transport system kinase n=1 Tax=Aureibacter tunicatorum TaxID=866807 RepID=A0AAE3XPJ7_9BACT|nr:methylmalonyl Co-A mutase-associated GTPase MeaB [Aureibacter tunicatorum]MDR6238924.1 LAO/AO transport system kinase [Aureibacter tunicatorum]BDD05149.1 ATPase/protein kinase [Aureibacter tunicatorum]